ncbi:MAG: cysteine desulfurase [Rhodospirillaceae bacterium]|nr:cysteine desulfurase [Rhodospirillaceae bacterium]
MENTRSIYLDYNSTSMIRPQVIKVLIEAHKNFNASSVHQFGVEARRKINLAREIIAESINVDPDGLVFTSGATEANVSIINNSNRRLVVSNIEHDSVLIPSRQKSDTKFIEVDQDGVISIESLYKILKKNNGPYIISTMLVNNETGVIQPIKEIADIAHKHNSLVHCDIVQGFGKIPIDINELGIDYATFSAHKVGGPQGIGGLWIKPGVEFEPLIQGGSQENFRRAGTENISGIIGFAESVKCFSKKETGNILSLRKKLEKELLKVAPVYIFGYNQNRVPNTVYFGNNKITKETQLVSLDLSGIAVSSGSACSSGKVGNSHVLEAMNIESKIMSSAIRVSLGWATKDHEIDYFISKWTDIYCKN